MTDRTWKKIQYMLLKMAEEDPNGLIEHLYHSGMDKKDIKDLKYVVNVARRAKGYNPEHDLLKTNAIC